VLGIELRPGHALQLSYTPGHKIAPFLRMFKRPFQGSLKVWRRPLANCSPVAERLKSSTLGKALNRLHVAVQKLLTGKLIPIYSLPYKLVEKPGVVQVEAPLF
jgi:hypothetical protein